MTTRDSAWGQDGNPPLLPLLGSLVRIGLVSVKSIPMPAKLNPGSEGFAERLTRKL